MSVLQPNGGWAPAPEKHHFQVAHDLLDQDYVQTSRQYRTVSIALSDRYNPNTECQSLELTIDEYAAFRRLGGETHTEACSIRGETKLMLGCMARAWGRRKRWLESEFEKECHEDGD